MRYVRNILRVRIEEMEKVRTAIFVLLLGAAAYAAPSKKMKADDMVAAENRSLHSYAPPPPAPRYSCDATVTSYNRRGYSADSDYMVKMSLNKDPSCLGRSRDSGLKKLRSLWTHLSRDWQYLICIKSI